MSEQPLEESVENPDVQDAVEDQHAVGDQETPDPDVIEAQKHGWTDKETFEADPKNEGKEWVDAKTFNLRGEFIGQIKGLEKRIEEIQSATKQVLEQNSKAVREETERRVRAELSEAVEQGDHERANKAVEDLAKLKEPPSEDAEVAAFKSRNKSWWDVDAEMTAVAGGLDYQLMQQGIPTETRLARVEARIRELYPQKFENQARTRPPAAETGGHVPKAKKNVLPPLSSLPEEFQAVGKQLAKMGTMTEQEYVKSLKDSGAI